MIELMLVAVIVSQVAILAMLVARRRPASIEAEGDVQVEPAEGTSLLPADVDLVEAVPGLDADSRAAVAALLNDEELAIQVDRSEPFMHLRFAADLPGASQPPDDPNLSRLLGSLGDVLPLIPKGLPDGYMIARFTPEVAKVLQSGEARLMVSQGQELMKAVSTSNGQTVSTARRVSESGSGSPPSGPSASWSRSPWSRPVGTINGGSTAPLAGSHEAPKTWRPAAGTTTTGPSSRERTPPSATSTSLTSHDPHHP